jgi:hypothetical protein
MTGIRPSLIAASRRRFNPLSLSPALWLSDTGSDPGVWPDLSLSGRNAIQTTPANQPAIITNALNGRQVRRFDGINDFMSQTNTILSNVSGATFFSVRRFSVLPTTQQPIVRVNITAILGRVRAGLIGGIPTSGKTSTYARRIASTETSATVATSTADVSTSDFQIQTGVINYATGAVSQFVNGSAAGTATLPTTGNSETASDETVIGRDVITASSVHFNGDMAESLVFPTALSTADRQRVESFFSQKYNIALA